MGARGRRSLASLTASVTALPARPDPPADLNAEQAVEWRAIVNRLPADWFPRETHGMLAAYCRHIVAARRVARLVEATDNKDVPALARLLRMQAAQTGAICTLAAKMRLSQSGSVDKRRAKGPAGPRPWEV